MKREEMRHNAKAVWRSFPEVVAIANADRLTALTLYRATSEEHDHWKEYIDRRYREFCEPDMYGLKTEIDR